MKVSFDKRISRKKHFFLTHPDCDKRVESYGSYPATPDGKCLCAKDVGYTNRCNAGEGFFDCRDCWDTMIDASQDNDIETLKDTVDKYLRLNKRPSTPEQRGSALQAISQRLRDFKEDEE